MHSHRLMTKGFIAIFILMIIFVCTSAVLDHKDDQENGCTPTGKQRFTNSVVNASDSALSTVVVQDEWKCKDGRIKWKTPYNG